MKSHSDHRQKSLSSVGATKSSKEQKQLAVSISILEIIEHEGLLAVTHSRVSLRSKVSRAWIYEYIGKEKSELIEFGAEVFSSHISRATLTELPKTKEELQIRLQEGVQFLFNSVDENPVIIKLFFRFRGTSNAVGKVIQKYEKHWLDGATATLINVLGLSGEVASQLAELILTLRIGFTHRIATSAQPKIARERAEQIFNLIHTLGAGFINSPH